MGAAVELRTLSGYPTLEAVDTTDISGNMPICMGLESLALLVNPDDFETNYKVTFNVSENSNWYGTYYLNLSNSTLKTYQKPGDTELGGNEADSEHLIPGNTDGYTQIDVAVSSEAEMKAWIGEMFINGG